MQERRGRAPCSDVRRATGIALVSGLAAVVAAVVHAGTGAVAQAVESLRLNGLLLLVLLHIPIVTLMGVAWWLASGDDFPAARSRFVWARFVRDAGAEVLPFLQFGGVVLGLRALGRGRAIAVRGAVATSIDGVIELTAKLPYMFAALMSLMALAPQSRLARPLVLALGSTGGFAAILLFARRWLSAWLEWAARAISRRLPAIFSPDGPSTGSDVQESFYRILRQRGRLWLAFALHLCCWCLGTAEVWVAFRLLGVDVTLLQALAIDGMVVGLRTFGFMVPGAVGVQEASYLLAAAVFGIPPPTAIAASFARRARDLTLGVATLGTTIIVASDGVHYRSTIRRLTSPIPRRGEQ
jgi:putative membrane protein